MLRLDSFLCSILQQRQTVFQWKCSTPIHIILTSSNEVGVREGVLGLHECPGMPRVENVKHPVSIDAHRFCRPLLCFLVGNGSSLHRRWQVTSQWSWPSQYNIVVLLITGLSY